MDFQSIVVEFSARQAGQMLELWKYDIASGKVEIIKNFTNQLNPTNPPYRGSYPYDGFVTSKY